MTFLALKKISPQFSCCSSSISAAWSLELYAAVFYRWLGSTVIERKPHRDRKKSTCAPLGAHVSPIDLISSALLHFQFCSAGAPSPTNVTTPEDPKTAVRVVKIL